MIYIGVGSNIEPERHIQQALRLLQRRGLSPRALSTHYRTAPVKHRENPSYINGVWQIHSALSYDETGHALSAIEEDLGRRREEDAYASRTIDLDILLHPGRPFAHKDILERNFVYLPLLELDVNIQLPDGRSLSGLINRNNTEGICPLPVFTEKLRSLLHG